MENSVCKISWKLVENWLRNPRNSIILVAEFIVNLTIVLPPNVKWNESSFRPPLCTYRLNWARRTSWGWTDDWDDTVLQTQDSKCEPYRSEAEHATSRSRRLPTILTSTRGWRRNIFGFFQTAETGNRTPSSGVKGSGDNHYPGLGPPPVLPLSRHLASLPLRPPFTRGRFAVAFE